MKLTLLQNMLNSQQIQELFDKLDTVTIKEKNKFSDRSRFTIS